MPAGPVTFAGLMTLYESNFIRLRWLVRDLKAIDAPLRSEVSSDCTLHLSVLEICRYTTTLRLTYLFDEDGATLADPDLRIRVYHDASLAEAMECGHRHRHEALRQFDTSSGSELQRRWTRNIMLNKWLEYCADKGHSFGPPERPDPDSSPT